MNITKKVVTCLNVSFLVSLGGLLFIILTEPLIRSVKFGPVLIDDVAPFCFLVLFVSMVSLLVVHLLPTKEDLLASEGLEIIRNERKLLGRKLTTGEFKIILDKIVGLDDAKQKMAKLVVYREMTLKEFEIFLDKCHKEGWFENAAEMVKFLESKFKRKLTRKEIGVALNKYHKEAWFDDAWEMAKLISQTIKGS